MSDFARRREMMVDTQVRPNDVTKYPVIAAMLRVPRENFVPDNRRDVAYSGENLDIGSDRVLLEPRSFAKMIDALDLQPTDLMLDLACGYGYGAAVLSHLVQAVVAVEDDERLSGEAAARLAKEGCDNVVVVTAPLTEGAPAQGPYDAILIEGGIQELPPAIADQLAEGGRIVALFQQGGLGVVQLGTKIDGRVNWRYIFNAHAPVLPGLGIRSEFAL